VLHRTLAQATLRESSHGEDDAGDAASRGRILLVIAHRMDTILDTDQLLVLSGGRLAESGPPSELAGRAGGLFAGMLSAAATAAGAVEGVAARKE
jgi:ABC-type multidrug transport system fused ATPase/permease subunit